MDLSTENEYFDALISDRNFDNEKIPNFNIKELIKEKFAKIDGEIEIKEDENSHDWKPSCREFIIKAWKIMILI